jgi:glycosyltransferase involved in cell wall biosynthesis
MSRVISPLGDLIALARLVGLLRHIKPSIVHTHTPKASLLGMIAAALLRVPVRVYTLHGLMIETREGWARSVLRIVERVVCRLAHRVLAVSASVKSAVVNQGLCPVHKVRVLVHGSCNGIDAVKFDKNRVSSSRVGELKQSYGIPEDAFVIGFVGRVTRDKGIEELVSAWMTIRGEYPQTYLMVIGPDEPADPAAIKLGSKFTQDARVIHVPWTDDMPEHYSLFDLLVLPSYREGFPYVILEASAMELPVVATRVTGCLDAIVDGETGTLVPMRDPVALAQAMRQYLDDGRLRKAHGLAGRARVVQDFRQEPVWEALYDEYIHLLQVNGLGIPHTMGDRAL